MNVFDIIGPIMVGPSSSHTAGAVRIGKIARAVSGGQPTMVTIELYGSFAQTYKGHGTDKAIIAGLLGMAPDDERIKDSLELARDLGMAFKFKKSGNKAVHPNTALIAAVDSQGKKTIVQGSSVGGGRIVVNRINEINVKFNGEYYTLLVPHHDTPGMIAAVTNLLADQGINIAEMNMYRSQRGGEAMMVIETDQAINEELVSLIEAVNSVKKAVLIKPIY
ncbi:L-serine ammonia-lyase, iron-sulfur-dependent subunit beta [Acetobacterium wieringae]|uniref:L-serine ammonia-lyase, iron-sulfur-dependent subunit beta n=1 Tax=Acetobacterium wieringae TaxID=52694 RepID=UPI002B21E42D|nr:L-serine ammonia-lyase, iron-sulfur-dependent subunit beta [Acetobacterium wieringae]MEA4804323.1 L-serine ammonia-lyase, iron-sulfur-dependent subunit beta [Acetobacterium wieringae]